MQVLNDGGTAYREQEVCLDHGENLTISKIVRGGVVNSSSTIGELVASMTTRRDGRSDIMTARDLEAVEAVSVCRTAM